MKIDWKRKFSSRKWQFTILVMIVSLAVLIIGDDAVERIFAIATMAITTLGYNFAEAQCDVADNNCCNDEQLWVEKGDHDE